MPLVQPTGTASSVPNNTGNVYQSNQNNSPQQQNSVHNPTKKQYKPHQIQQSQHKLSKVEATTTAPTNIECESSTQTSNVVAEGIATNNLLDVTYQEDDIYNQDENDDCDNSINGCLSITTTTSTKNYDRIEVQKFKNQATSPNIPINEKDEIKNEHSFTQNRDTPHSSRSTPFSNSDALAKRSFEEPRTSWTQSYQAADGSTVFHTTLTSTSATNPYCTPTYQQAPDGSIYAVPQGMIYAYPQPVEGEFHGYFMPVLDPSQQRNDTSSLLQSGTQAIYPTGGTTTMVPVAAYPPAQFTATNGAPIYPSQVLYSGEQFQTASAPLTATASASATAQLQQIPMTSYPIGYPYAYNGYWGQAMTYYVPQQTVPTTSLLSAPPTASAPASLNHVAGGVNTAGLNGVSTTAGLSANSLNITSDCTGHIVNKTTQQTNHQNSPTTTGYKDHVHAVGSGAGSSHSGGTTYYGTGRIKRPTPSHFSSTMHNGSHQLITATTIPNSVTTATYQLGHGIPTLTLATPPQAAATPIATDLTSGGGGPSTTSMYAFPQHATIFPTNMFQYATSTAGPSIVPQSVGMNVAPQTAIIHQSGNPQGHITGISGQTNSTSGTIHNLHNSNTMITPFYTPSYHHAPQLGMQSSSHTIHTPGPSAIPIVDPATVTNGSQLVSSTNSMTYNGRVGIGGSTAGASQSAPSTPHSMPSLSSIHLAQRNSSVFSTPTIMANNGGSFSVSSTPKYYGNTEFSHQPLVSSGGGKNSNSPHILYSSSSHEKRNNLSSGSAKKPLSYQCASLSRQNSNGGYNSTTKPLLSNGKNNDTGASPDNCLNSRPHSIKRGENGATNDKPQTTLLSGLPSFVGSANIQNTNNTNSYQAIAIADIGACGISIGNPSKPPIRLNAAAVAFRQKGPAPTSNNSAVEHRRNTVSQRNSPGTNASSNENSNNNSPNSTNNSSNAVTPFATGGYGPSYMINAQNNAGEPVPTLQPSLYIATASSRGHVHIPPHLQSSAANRAGVPAAIVTATANVPQQGTTAVISGGAADVAAATVAHHQPLLGAYNPAASGLYFKYGHAYFAHPSVALPNSRRSPSTDLRPPIAQMAGMYPTVNMMIPAQPRHLGRQPNPNYKGTRPR